MSEPLIPDSNTNRVFFDTEFHDDGHSIEFISIGMVKGDGSVYSATSSEFHLPRARQNPFLRENVLPKLPPIMEWKSRRVIAKDVVEFCGPNPEFWADYCSYDWVALCQLYGPMVALPAHFPFYCNDVQNLRNTVKSITGYDKPLPEPVNEHSALSDAFNVRDRYNILSVELYRFLDIHKQLGQ